MSATIDEPECKDCGEIIAMTEAPLMKPCKRCGYYMHAECGMGFENELDEWCETCLEIRSTQAVIAERSAGAA